MALKVTFVNKNRKREIVDFGSVTSVAYLAKEPLLVCHVDIDGVPQLPGYLTGVEQMLIIGTLSIESLNDEDFRRAGVSIAINCNWVAGAKNLLPLHYNDVSAIQDQQKDNNHRYLTFQGLISTPSRGVVNPEDSLSGFYRFSQDCTVMSAGYEVYVSAGVWVHCTQVLTFSNPRGVTKMAYYGYNY